MGRTPQAAAARGLHRGVPFHMVSIRFLVRFLVFEPHRPFVCGATTCTRTLVAHMGVLMLNSPSTNAGLHDLPKQGRGRY